MSQLFVVVGRTTQDVELKYTQGGMAIASFTVACDRYNAKKLKEEGKQSTDFFNCISFKGQAEYLAKHLKKGKLVEVQGEVNVDVVTGDDGKNKYYTKVVCSKANVLEYVKNDQSDDFNFGYNTDDFQAIDDDDPNSVPF